MPPTNPRRQEDIFYGGTRWNRIYEDEFLKGLAEWARESGSTIKRSDVVAIRTCIDTVNAMYGTKFLHKDAQTHFKQLQERHGVFDFFVTLPHVTYDMELNRVLAEPFIWDYVTLKYLLAEAYMTRGEPRWTDICSIFGPPKPIDVFAEPEAIQISFDQCHHINQNSIVKKNHERDALDNSAPLELSASFWQNLRRLVGVSDVASQDSVHNEPAQNATLRPLTVYSGADYDTLWTPDIEKEFLRALGVDPNNKHGISQASSSATPVKSGKKCAFYCSCSTISWRHCHRLLPAVYIGWFDYGNFAKLYA